MRLPFFNDEMAHKSNTNQRDLCRVAGVMKVSLNPRFEVHAHLVGFYYNSILCRLNY
jgi:hypothetical protein